MRKENVLDLIAKANSHNMLVADLVKNPLVLEVAEVNKEDLEDALLSNPLTHLPPLTVLKKEGEFLGVTLSREVYLHESGEKRSILTDVKMTREVEGISVPEVILALKREDIDGVAIAKIVAPYQKATK